MKFSASVAAFTDTLSQGLSFFSTFSTRFIFLIQQLFFVLLPYFHIILQAHLYVSIFTTNPWHSNIFVVLLALLRHSGQTFQSFRFVLFYLIINFLTLYFCCRSHSSLSSLAFFAKYSSLDIESLLLCLLYRSVFFLINFNCSFHHHVVF